MPAIGEGACQAHQILLARRPHVVAFRLGVGQTFRAQLSEKAAHLVDRIAQRRRQVGPEGGGPDLEFIEFGDFDADGKTEVVLFYSGYNRDGYVLLHSGMTKKVEFLWGYH